MSTIGGSTGPEAAGSGEEWDAGDAGDGVPPELLAQAGPTPTPPPAGEPATDAAAHLAVRSEVVYVGMGDHTDNELRALRGAEGGVLGITGKSPGAFEVEIGGERRTYDLTDRAAVEAFASDVGLGDESSRAVSVMILTAPGAREEMAQLIKAFAEAERGERTIERLILSGHGSWEARDHIAQTDGGKLGYDDLAGLSKLFPRAAGQVEDVLTHACWQGLDEGPLNQLRGAFPNMKSWTGFSGRSPRGDSEIATAELRVWEGATRGHDAGRVDGETFRAAWDATTDKWRKMYDRRITTWNAEDGWKQGRLQATPTPVRSPPGAPDGPPPP